MKKILVLLLALTSAVYAQVTVFTPEEAEAFNKAHPELENPSEYYVIDESLGYCSISQKDEKMLNLIMDKIIAILEEESDNNSKEGE